MRRGLVITLVLVGIVGAIDLLRTVSSSEEAVRVRNSLIFEVVDLSELEWTPAKYPKSFKLDSAIPPRLFQKAAAHIRSDTDRIPDFETALAIGRELAVGRVKGGAIQADTATTFTTILNEGVGYCADFTQVFNGLAHASAMPVREWGMSFDGFGGNGHAFNEVYDESSQEWLFIDIFYSFYVVDRSTKSPLSALEFRERLKDRRTWASVRVVPISDTRFAFTSEEAALEYYYRGVNEFYMWWGNNVFEYDESSAVQLASRLPRSIEQGVAILTGVHPRIKIPLSDENEAAIRDLQKLRNKVLAILLLEFVIVAMIIYQLFRFARNRLGRSRVGDTK